MGKHHSPRRINTSDDSRVFRGDCSRRYRWDSPALRTLRRQKWNTDGRACVRGSGAYPWKGKGSAKTLLPDASCFANFWRGLPPIEGLEHRTLIDVAADSSPTTAGQVALCRRGSSIGRARRDQHRRRCSSIRDTDTRKPMLPGRDSRHHLQTNARPAIQVILRQPSRPFAHGKEQR